MKYERSILQRRTLPTVEFTTSYTGKLLTFSHEHNQKFHNEYDAERYKSVLKIATDMDISEEIWPYYHIEDNFYQYNSFGYRTYEFDYLDNSFDIAIGCCCVEGLGMRYKETWAHHYENFTGRQLINLGKGGTGCNYININISAWLTHYPQPKRIIIFWSDPTSRTVFRSNGDFTTLQYGNQRIHPTINQSDEKINSWYKAELQDRLISSNEFILTYINTNIILRQNNISVKNFFPSIYWSEETVEKIGQLTKTTPHYLSYNNTEGGWAKFRNYQYFPAADMTHHGLQHQKPIATQIIKTYENT